MPNVTSTVIVPVDPTTAFAVAQTTGEVRLRWDPFIRRQYFLAGATDPAVGVQTYTRHRWGLGMVSEYVSYAPPTNVGMKMVRGPWFFSQLAGGWRFAAAPGGTKATWKYSFHCVPPGSHPSPKRSDAACCNATSTGASPGSRVDAATRSCWHPCGMPGAKRPEACLPTWVASSIASDCGKELWPHSRWLRADRSFPRVDAFEGHQRNPGVA